MSKIINYLIIIIMLVPSVVFCECVEYKIIDHGDSIEAVCVGMPLTAAEQTKRDQERDIAQNAEQYINGRSRQQYEQCQALIPATRDYGKMTLGEVWVANRQNKDALLRAELLGCIPRGSSSNGGSNSSTANKFITCNTYGRSTQCSDGSSFMAVGNTIIGSNGTNCTVFGTTMNCFRP